MADEQELRVTVDEVLCLARLAMRLGEVERSTWHPDGQRRETDTTHSVMLALVAAVAADRVGLDPGRAALFALVHDLPEAYAGDVDTSVALDAQAREQKARSEEEALARILAETESMPVLRRLLLRYEARSSPEAQLVHVLDKAMPKAVRLLHLAEGGPGLHQEQVRSAHAQAERLRASHPSPLLAGTHQLLRELVDRLCAAVRP